MNLKNCIFIRRGMDKSMRKQEEDRGNIRMWNQVGEGPISLGKKTGLKSQWSLYIMLKKVI
jgi:hypothetical protein